MGYLIIQIPEVINFGRSIQGTCSPINEEIWVHIQIQAYNVMKKHIYVVMDLDIKQ